MTGSTFFAGTERATNSEGSATRFDVEETIESWDSAWLVDRRDLVLSHLEESIGPAEGV